MKVKVKKSILFNVINLLKEHSRSDIVFDNTQSNFAGNFGSMKGPFDDDTPIAPSPHMAIQLSAAEPPVADPDYIPASKEELKLAAARIIREVPSNQIETFYRLLHKALDVTIDDVDDDIFTLKEALDLNNRRLYRMLEKGVDILSIPGTKIKPEEQAMFTAKKLGINTTEGYEEVLQYFKDNMTAQIEYEEYKEDPVDVDVSDVLPSASETEKSSQQKEIEIPDEQYIKQQDTLTNALAYADAELEEMSEYAATWNFDDPVSKPYLKTIFKLIRILHELSYRVMQAEYYTKYGGYEYDPKAEGRGKQKGAFIIIKQGPRSRKTAVLLQKEIENAFGFTYDNIIRQRNVIKMSMNELKSVIDRAITGIMKIKPGIYEEILVNSTGKESAANAIDFIVNVIAHKYKGESGILDRDLVSIAISGVFKRALLELPVELKLQPTVSIPLNRLAKRQKDQKDIKPKKSIIKGFVLMGVYKKFKKLAKNKKYAAQFRKLLPPIILKSITDSKTAKIKKVNNDYIFIDKETNLEIKESKQQLKQKIKDYVNKAIDGATSYSIEEKEDIALDTSTDYDPEKEIQGLPPDEQALKKYVDNLNKMISGSDYDLAAPLFGFSSASGIRQWYLKFPDRKIRLIIDGRRGVPGAKEFMNAIDNAAVNIAYSLSSEEGDSIIRLLQQENLDNPNRGKKEKAELKLMSIIEQDLEKINDVISVSKDIAYTKATKEYQDLMQQPGGKIFRNATGLGFNNIVTRSDKPWQDEMTKILVKLKVPEHEARHLQQHLTGLKEIPDFKNSGVTAQKFISYGIDESLFVKLKKDAVSWFYNHLANNINDEQPYGKILSKIPDRPLYKYNPKSGEWDLNSGGKKQLKDIMKKVIDEYLSVEAISQYQEKAKEQIAKAKEEFPKINESKLDKILELYI